MFVPLLERALGDAHAVDTELLPAQGHGGASSTPTPGADSVRVEEVEDDREGVGNEVGRRSDDGLGPLEAPVDRHRRGRLDRSAAEHGRAGVRVRLLDGLAEQDRTGRWLGQPAPGAPHRKGLPGDGFGVGPFDDGPDLAGVFVRPTQRLGHEAERRRNPVLERRIAVGLAQNPDAVAEPGDVGPEARARVERRPPAWLAPLRFVVPVIREITAVLRFIALGYGGQPRLAQQAVDGGGRVRMERRRIRQVVAVDGPVRRVEVDDDVRVVVVEEPGEGAGLGRVELDEVAVEVEAVGVGALAHAVDGAVLERPVARVEALVPVGVVDRGDEDRERIGPGGVLTAGEVAEEEERRLLPRHLARVDVRHDEHTQAPAGPRRRCRRVVRALNDERERPPLDGLAERRRVEARLRADDLDERHHVGVRGGRAEVRCFGPRAERVERLRHERRGENERERDGDDGETQHGRRQKRSRKLRDDGANSARAAPFYPAPTTAFMPHIVATATGFPPHYYSQDEISTSLQEIWAGYGVKTGRIAQLHENTTVGGRYIAVPKEEYYALRGWEEPNAIYARVAVELGERVLTAALAEGGLDAADLGLLAFASTTGIAIPTIDARLLNRMPFADDVKRLPIFGMGCVAGVAGTARVADYLRGHPTEAAVLLAEEFCSLTIQKHDVSIANLIACGLFGDAAGAVLLVGDAHPLAHADAGVEVVATRSVFFPDTEHYMGWEIKESGMQIVLSADVPSASLHEVSPLIRAFLAEHDLEPGDIGRWVAHPGGPKVIEALEEGLGLGGTALQRSRDVLQSVGNVSSVSVLLILDAVMREDPPPPGTWGLMLAMGPGFVAELILLRW